MNKSNYGISPTIGVTILIAITVILSASIGLFLVDMGENQQTPPPSIGVNTEVTENQFTVTVIRGSTDTLEILVNGASESKKVNVSPGDSVSATVENGDSITVLSSKTGSTQTILTTDISSVSKSAPSLPTDGLIAHWELNGGAVDSTGTYNGTLVGPPTETPEAIKDTALYFDASNDYISISDGDDESTWAPENGLTVTMWVRPDNNDDWARLISYGRTATNTSSDEKWGIIWHKRNSAHMGKIKTGGNSHTVSAGKTLPKDEWSHIALTYDNETLKMYLDGSMVDENNSPSGQIDVSSAPLQIGAAGPNEKYGGEMDEVRLYGKALDSTEINSIYSETNPEA